MQRQNALSDLENRAVEVGGLVIWSDVYSVRNRPSAKLQVSSRSAQSQATCGFSRGISPSIASPASIIYFQRAALHGQTIPQHLLQGFASWVAGGIFRQIDDLDLVSQSLID